MIRPSLLNPKIYNLETQSQFFKYSIQTLENLHMNKNGKWQESYKINKIRIEPVCADFFIANQESMKLHK